MESGIYFVKGRKGWYRRKQVRNKERKDKTLEARWHSGEKVEREDSGKRKGKFDF